MSSFFYYNIDNDKLPKIICTQCIKKLQQAYDFRELCIKTTKNILDKNKNSINKKHNENLDCGDNPIKKYKRLFSPEPKSFKTHCVGKKNSTDSVINDAFVKIFGDIIQNSSSEIEINGEEKEMKDEETEVDIFEDSYSIDQLINDNTEITDECDGDNHKTKDLTFVSSVSLIEERERMDCTNNTRYDTEFINVENYITTDNFCLEPRPNVSNLKLNTVLVQNVNNLNSPFNNANAEISLPHHTSDTTLSDYDQTCNEENIVTYTVEKLCIPSVGTSVSDDSDFEFPFICSTCDKGFRTSVELEVHLKTHAAEEKYTCTKCDKVLRNAKEYANHLCDDVVKELLTCPFCSKNFSTTSALITHKLHEHIKLNICTVCFKKFSSPKTLRHHMRLHEKRADLNKT